MRGSSHKAYSPAHSEQMAFTFSLLRINGAVENRVQNMYLWRKYQETVEFIIPMKYSLLKLQYILESGLEDLTGLFFFF